jgi:hypothetical protein
MPCLRGPRLPARGVVWTVEVIGVGQLSKNDFLIGLFVLSARNIA